MSPLSKSALRAALMSPLFPSLNTFPDTSWFGIGEEFDGRKPSFLDPHGITSRAMAPSVSGTSFAVFLSTHTDVWPPRGGGARRVGRRLTRFFAMSTQDTPAT